MADANQLARPAVERLSEDESLRGDLSDIGFGPLLDWAVAAVTAYAAKAADSDAMDQYTGRVRGVVQAAVEAAQAAKLDDPAPLLDFDPADRNKALADLQALSLGDDPDANAEQIAAILQSALSSTPASPAVEATPAEPPPASAETLAAPVEATPAVEPAAEIKKNEPAGAGEAGAAQAPGPQQNPETPPQTFPPGPRTGALFDSVKSRVGQAYNSAWGIFKGLSKRRS